MSLRKPPPPPVIRVFEAPSIFEAYSKLKREMGESAVILTTRTISKGGVLGLWGQKMVQITASNGVKAPNRLKNQPREESEAPPAPRADAMTQAPAQAARRAISGYAATTTATAPGATGTVEPQVLDEFKGELLQIRRMISEMQESSKFRHWPNLPAEFQKAFEKLQSYNIHEDIARALIHRWREHYPDYNKGTRVDIKLLESYIGEMIVPGGPIHFKEGKRPAVVMMVGPTGVGKTTSIAKLAAKYKIKLGKKVALITIDTYRIAATEQLRTYSDLIGVPLKVAATPADLRAAIDMHADKDLVLIDTAGRSPRNAAKMGDLLEFVNAAKPDELHLVMSIGVNNDVMRDTLESFASFPVHKLLLTKLDEAVHYGVVLTILSKAQKPIGYITTGQEVPDDIEIADARRLSRLILNLEKIRG